MLDYEFLALLICGAFGWTLPQVFALTWPQFCKVGEEVRRIQFQRAKNEIYFGICAALGGGEMQEILMQSAGDVITEKQPDLSYTAEQLAAAEKRMAELNEQRKRQEEQKHGL